MNLNKIINDAIFMNEIQQSNLDHFESIANDELTGDKRKEWALSHASIAKENIKKNNEIIENAISESKK